jgi:hypothetical protein
MSEVNLDPKRILQMWRRRSPDGRAHRCRDRRAISSSDSGMPYAST